MHTYSIHAHLNRPVNDGEESHEVGCILITTTQDWEPCEETSDRLFEMAQRALDHLGQEGDYYTATVTANEGSDLDAVLDAIRS